MARRKFLLARGQRKSITTDRLILVPSPSKERKVVRWMFAQAARHQSEYDIAHNLNGRKIPNTNGRPWTPKRVYELLTNEKYAGTLVWNRASTKLKQPLVNNDPKDWIRAEGAIEPIVGRAVYAAVQTALNNRHKAPTLEGRLAPLRRLFRKHGYLDQRLIDDAAGETYRRWFGSLHNAYRLVGYTKYRPYNRRSRPMHSRHFETHRLSKEQMLQLLRGVLHKHGRLTHKIVNDAVGVSSALTYCKRFGSVRRAYELAGYLSDDHFLELLRALLWRTGYLTGELINATPGIPHACTHVRRFGGKRRVYGLINYVPSEHYTPRKERPRPCRRYSNQDLLDGLRRLWRRYGRLTIRIIGMEQTGASYTTIRKTLRQFAARFQAYRVRLQAPP
jgi:hypothetical protein